MLTRSPCFPLPRPPRAVSSAPPSDTFQVFCSGFGACVNYRNDSFTCPSGGEAEVNGRVPVAQSFHRHVVRLGYTRMDFSPMKRSYYPFGTALLELCQSCPW